MLPPPGRVLLQRANIEFLGDLAQRKEHELYKIRGFKKQFVKEVQWTLERFGLSLGMSLDHPVIVEFNKWRRSKQ